MKKAIYPGSFDPLTNGHVDIIKRALKIVDSLTLAVLINTSKKPLFSIEERVEIIKEALKDLPQVEVDTFSGLLVDFCRKKGISLVIRGLRAVNDFDYEHAIFLMNRELYPEIETIFLMSSSENSFISSSIIKEVVSLGGVEKIKNQVPPVVFSALKKKYGRSS